MVSHFPLRLRLFLLLFCVATKKANGLATSQPRKKFGRSEKVTERKNQNGDVESRGYSLRTSGIKTTRKRPPRWEVEGDSLFFLANGDEKDEDHTEKDELQAATYILRNAFKVDEKEFPNQKAVTDFATSKVSPAKIKIENNCMKNDVKNISKKKSFPSSAMWGKCSVGPILGSRLSSIYEFPNQVQENSFSILTKNKSTNAVIASPTGTGKTLAFLLPIMSTTRRSDMASVIIVTPNIELSLQIQREVNKLWLPKSGNSALYVVQQIKTGKDEGDCSIEEESVMVNEIIEQKPPIIAGTPRSLLALISYCRKHEKKSVLSNLQTVILDEADRLLQTETVARNRKANKKEKIKNKPSTTEALLSQLQFFGLTFDYYSNNSPISRAKKKLRLICVSATVGRALRRQIFEITGAPSIDKAATLICDDSRTNKNEFKRRNGLLPPSLRHKYALINTLDTATCDENIIDALWSVMQEFPPAPSIIFAGKFGVFAAVDILQSKYNLKGACTLRDYDYDATSITGPKEYQEQNAVAWNDVPIFVVGEKFARGLDIPSIKYVFLSSPPKSPAAYTHLAGRTGRNGNDGIAVTLVNGRKEAHLFVSLSKTLGIHVCSD